MKVHLWPSFNTKDDGDGGIRRVVEAQLKHCPKYGVEFVEDPTAADVIACHIHIPDEYLRRFSRKAIVTHCHGAYHSEYANPDGSSMWPKWCLQANVDVISAALAADITTSPSEWVSQMLRRNTCRDIRTVPHGVDLEDWPVTTPDPRLYIAFLKSRPDPVCDPQPLERLAALMPQENFLSTFTIEPPASNVTVTGRVRYEESRELTAKAGIYLATTRETFGIGILEAMASGVPIVGWKWGAQREFIDHGVDGWLAQPHDVEGLKEGIEWVNANRAKVSAAARAKAEQYTWDGPAQMYAEIYEEAVAKRGGIPKRFQGATIIMPPKVSVIVTAYNLEQYLPFALASVLKQDDEFTDWECIIVDDNSTDRSGAIADEWTVRDPRFRVIHNEKNLKPAGARNVGVMAARGMYVTQLDADDMINRGALGILAAALDADRQIHVAYGGVLFVNEDGVTPTDYGTGKPGDSGWPIDFRVDLQLRAPTEGRRPNNLVPYSAMVRREALMLTGGYRARREGRAEDADLWCRLSSYGFTPKRVTTAPMLIYRNREGSVSRTNPPDDWTMWYPWSRLPDLIPAGAMVGAANNALAVSSCDPPIIAVIIPVGPGHEEILIDAIDSVDSQTFRQFECIVVNDTGHELPPMPTWVRVIEPTMMTASINPALINESEEITLTYPDDFKAKRLGPAACRNIGIESAIARLYIPLDADDMLRPHALRMMYERYMEPGDQSVVYSDFWEDPEVEGEFRIMALPDFDDQLLANQMLGCVTQLTPVAAWAAVGGYDESIPAWEDWDFQIKLCDAGYCMRHVAVPLWTYRKHTGSRRDHQYAHRDDPGGAKDIILNRYPDIWPDVAQARGIPLKGKDPLMGCRSCGGGGGGTGIVNIQDAQRPIPLAPTADGAMLVEYIGDRQGGMEFRANTEAIYKFALGEDAVKYVHPADLDYFANKPDFRIIAGSAASLAPEATFAPPPPVGGPQGADEPQGGDEAAQIAQNQAVLAETKARTKRKAGAPPPGVTVE